MRKLFLVISALVGLVVIGIAALVFYAAINLDSIIAANRDRILNIASDAVGRPVEAQAIKAHIGWGVMMDVSGVKIDDDPAFSQLPFLQAGDIYLRVEFLPLLFKSVKVTSLVVDSPQVRIIRNGAGVLNVDSIGKKAKKPKELKRPSEIATPEREKEVGQNEHGLGGLAALSVRSLEVNNAQLFYQDQQSAAPPVTINDVNLAIEDFSVYSPFHLALTLAALGNDKNFDLSGQAGPLVRNDAVDPNLVPVDLTMTAGPFSMAQLKSIPQLARALPPQLSLTGPLQLNAKLKGTLDSAQFEASGDLTSNAVAYSGILDKPAGVPLKFDANGSRDNGAISVRLANLVLANAELKASDIKLEGSNIAARIDSNDFDLAGLAKILIPAQRYNPTGTAAIHANVRVIAKHPIADGTVTLSKVNATLPDANVPAVGNLTGPVRIDGNSANVGPLTFDVGSGHAKLEANAQSLQPLKATYQFSADAIKIGEIVPKRKDLGEQVNQIASSGDLSRDGKAIAATTRLTSASGTVANVPYNNLALAAAFSGDRLTIDSLKLNAFDGAVGASGVATTGSTPTFNLNLNADKVDVQKALAAQKSKAAATIRGDLTAKMQIAGSGSNFDDIKPTLHGNGSGSLDNGKLVGVNVVSQALGKVNNLPGIGSLVPAAVVNRHPELFKSNDTDIQEAMLTFQVQGPRIITHDLKVTSLDYSLLGDGWFDMDRNIDLGARILLSPSFSNELISARKNVVYLANENKQVEIPLRVVGQLPKPSILPDLTVLAERATSNALSDKLGGLFGKKKGGGSLGGLFGGGGNNGNGGGSGSSSKSNNPLDQLKGLFH
jgi:AsmA-like C-terminal region/AsmA family